MKMNGIGRTPPSSHIPQLLDPGSGTPITLSEVLPAFYLHTANFFALSMTRDGTGVFADGPGVTWFVIDEPGLATGRLTPAKFGSNGHFRVSTLRRPWNIGPSMSFEQILGKFLCEIAESGIGGPPQYNERYVLPDSDREDPFCFFISSFGSSNEKYSLDMDLPILELLESTRRANKFLYPGYGSLDLWVRVIEESAPGYREQEFREGGGI